jgi:MFS family permease
MTITDKLLPKKRGKFFYGWWIVIACILMHFMGGGAFFYGFSVFFNPIRDEFGWTAAQTSIAFTLRGLETGAFSPLVGILVDRMGPRTMMVSGWVVIGLGFMVMSQIHSLWAFYGAFLLVALGMSFGTGIVMNTVVANWFNKKRSRALALVFIGPGISGVLAPVLALGIAHLDWRNTLLITGIVLLSFGVPLSFLFRHKPGDYGYLPDGDNPSETTEIVEETKKVTKQNSYGLNEGYTGKEALKTQAFWLLSMVFFFQALGTSAVTVHIVPYLESGNVPTEIAAIAVTGLTLCSLIGRIGFGFLGDFMNKRILIAISLVIQTVGLLIFAFVTEDKIWLLIPFLLTYSPGFGGPIPLRAALQADFFGTKNYGTIMGLIGLIGTLGGLVSPIVAGWVYDTLGSYHIAWIWFAILSAPAIPIILLTKAPPRKTSNLT